MSRRLVPALLLAVGPVAAVAMPVAPARAEPTAAEVSYLNAVRGTFPGDDPTLLLVGRRMCHMLYAGDSSGDVVAVLAAEYGASTDQAGVALRAARSTLCTQPPA